MGTVVALRRPVSGQHSGAARGFNPAVPALDALSEMFSTGRRDRQDAFWLKENAEFLQIICATGVTVDLSAYQDVVSGLMADLTFFPQYYRMFLSIALDLRACGVQGVPVEQMVSFIQAMGLPDGEVSDVHRAEVALLLARAGVNHPAGDLDARLTRFAARPARFAVPNLRACYDLTHLVFHGADYGRRALARDAQRDQSLMNAGIMAWLADNTDLLAEVTIALRLSDVPVPDTWDAGVAADLARFGFETGADDEGDDYHAYLVQNWAVALAGGPAFAGTLPQGVRRITSGAVPLGTLRALQVDLLDLGAARSPDWEVMRGRLVQGLGVAQRARLAQVEQLPAFPGFFAGFARAYGAGT